MPEWFKKYLAELTAPQKSELGCYILQSPDNDVTTAMIEIIDPPHDQAEAQTGG